MDPEESGQGEGEEGESQVQGEEGEEEYGEEESAQDDDIFKNNHDLIGVEGILRAQKNEVDKKKLELRF